MLLPAAKPETNGLPCTKIRIFLHEETPFLKSKMHPHSSGHFTSVQTQRLTDQLISVRADGGEDDTPLLR